MADRAYLIGAAAYLLVAIVTFGHAAAHAERVDAIEKAECVAKQVWCPAGIPAFNGIAAGLVWPLYWSWEAFSNDA